MISLTDDDARFASEQLSGGCATMEQLLSGLLDSEGRVAEEVHAIRKLGKSLRGGFSLFRLKNSAREIQAIGRLLSGSRDAVSRLSTWGKVAWEDDAKASAAILGLLDQQIHSAASRPPSETIAWCLERVAEARKNLSELPSENLAARIAKGEKKLSKQVTKRCKNLDHNAEEDFHDARKAIKAYLGALKFLPEESVLPDSKMVDLAEILGDENDLATLTIWLEEHGFTAHFVPTLWKKLKSDRSALRKQAIEDAEQLTVD
jgi:hypothetical protein